MRPVAWGPRRSWWFAVFAVLVPLVVMAPWAWVPKARAASSADGPSLSLTPARVSAVVAAGTFNFSVSLYNPSDAALQVRLEPASLGQDQSGAATFGLGQNAVPLDVATSNPIVGAHTRRRVEVTVPVAPTTAGVYEALVAYIGRSGTSDTISTQSAVASLIELRGPGVGRPAASIHAAHATATGARTRSVFIGANVTDTGNILIAPNATAFVRQGTSLLATVPLAVPRIVPGSTVGIQGVWDVPSRLSGNISITVDLTNPTAQAATTLSFADGAALEAAARIRDLRVQRTAAGVLVSFRVANVGRVLVEPVMSITIFADHRWGRASSEGAAGRLRPGRSRLVARHLGLSPGPYEIAVRIYAGPNLLDQGEAFVRVSGPTDRVPLGGAVLILGLAATCAWTWLRFRRRSRAGGALR